MIRTGFYTEVTGPEFAEVRGQVEQLQVCIARLAIIAGEQKTKLSQHFEKLDILEGFNEDHLEIIASLVRDLKKLRKQNKALVNYISELHSVIEKQKLAPAAEINNLSQLFSAMSLIN